MKMYQFFLCIIFFVYQFFCSTHTHKQKNFFDQNLSEKCSQKCSEKWNFFFLVFFWSLKFWNFEIFEKIKMHTIWMKKKRKENLFYRRLVCLVCFWRKLWNFEIFKKFEKKLGDFCFVLVFFERNFRNFEFHFEFWICQRKKKREKFSVMNVMWCEQTRSMFFCLFCFLLKFFLKLVANIDDNDDLMMNFLKLKW